MISSFSNKIKKYQQKEVIDPEAVWYDLLRPTAKERQTLSKMIDLPIPTQEEMEEIETSSRLYRVQDTLYMTAVLMAKAESENPLLSAVTFIFNKKTLITIRYTEPKPFYSLIKKIEKQPENFQTADTVFLGLLETIVDRVADILEKIGTEIDGISKEIFENRTSSSKRPKQLDEILNQIGKKGDLTTKTKESLVSLGRLLIFYSHHSMEKKQNLVRIKTMQRDVNSITEHVSFLLNKINFLLDATLGYTNIEQNRIIKIFSVAAVIFLPPTVIASIYGMNFIDMPEIHWSLGYPFALVLMVLSATLPFIYFKRKGWL